MKLIVEKKNGRVYVYRESERMFKFLEKLKERKNRISGRLLDEDCDVCDYYDDFYMVFNLKGKKRQGRGEEIAGPIAQRKCIGFLIRGPGVRIPLGPRFYQEIWNMQQQNKKELTKK